MYFLLSFSSLASQAMSVAVPNNSKVSAIDDHNLLWFINNDHLIKSDGRFQFIVPIKTRADFKFEDVTQLIARTEFVYLITRNAIWRYDLYKESTAKVFGRSAQQIFPLNENDIGFISEGSLYYTLFDQVLKVPFNENVEQWSAFDDQFYGVTKERKIWFWDSETSAKAIGTSPWDITSLAATPFGLAAISDSQEVFFIQKNHIDFLGINNAIALTYFEHGLYAMTRDSLIKTELSPPFQKTISNWPGTKLSQLSAAAKLWLLDDKNSWFMPLQKHYFAKEINDPTLNNEPQRKVLATGFEAFQHFAKQRLVYDIAYLTAERWAIATDAGVYWFSDQLGFERFSDKTDIIRLVYTGKNELWMSTSTTAYIYNIQSETLLETKFAMVDDIDATDGDLSFLTSQGQVVAVDSNSDSAIPINLPKKISDAKSVFRLQGNQYLIGAVNGTWLVSSDASLNFTVEKKLSEFSPIKMSQSNEGVWLINSEQVAHLFYSERHSELNKTLYQIDTLTEKALPNYSPTSYRNKVLYVSDEHLYVLDYQANAKREDWQISHIRFNSASKNTYDLSLGQHVWRPKPLIEAPSFTDSATLWLSGCEQCAFQFSVNNGPWTYLNVGEMQFDVPLSKNVEIEILHSGNQDSEPKHIIIKANIIHAFPWNSLFIATLLGAVVTIAWLWVHHQRKRHNEFAEALMNHSKDAIWLADEQFKIVEVNEAYCQVTGFRPSQVVGRRPKIRTKNGRNRELESYIAREVESSGHWSGELWMIGSHGKKIALDLAITKLALKKRAKAHFYYLGVFSDITPRKESEQALLNLSTRDALTGLPNRTLFMESCNQAIASCNETFPSLLVILVDIDNFRKINDLLGHQAGDFLLKDVATRLQTSLDKGFTIARYSSDEFAVLVPSYLYSGMTVFFAKKLADTILKSFNRPFIHNDVETKISASCGIAIYPDNGFDTEHILRAADTALSAARKQGQNRYQFFDNSVHSLDAKVLTQETALLKGIENKEFLLVYQPKYSSQNNELTGFEALARWPQSDGSSIPPSEFVALAESNGTIIKLTELLLEQAFSTIQTWYKLHYTFGRVAINISALHFQNQSLLDTLSALLNKYTVPAYCIELEITESAMMDNPELALLQMRSLKALGFTIALDDFGTGHSSLGHLKKFPIDVLKIDRSFIQDIVVAEQDRNITSTIIRLAKYLNMEVVAEGVETEEQAYLLNVMGCTTLQGFYFSKPLMIEAVVSLLETKKKDILAR